MIGDRGTGDRGTGDRGEAGEPGAPQARRDADDAGAVQVGDVLNQIFVAKRLIARGRISDVFEGADIASGDRVAIEVFRPAIATDPKFQALLRNEAPTLKRMSHNALVHYRELGHEPRLGAAYIVTDFIDGTKLSPVLGQVNFSLDELRDFARRLADGLQSAHALGAVHYDISPNNIMLRNGRLDRAMIIDFGFAKAAKVGGDPIGDDRFAYVSPEQLGEFGGEAGPPSDVYSLGLVLLAMAMGRDPDMGATRAEAIDRRRSGADLTALPPTLRPVVERMLAFDPNDRLASMAAVIAAFDAAPVTAPPAPPPPQVDPERAPSATKSSDQRQLMLGGAGLAALLVLGFGYWLATSGAMRQPDEAAIAVASAPGAADAASAQLSVTDRARAAIEETLPAIGCSWLDIGDLQPDGAGVRLTLRGAVRDPADVHDVIARALVVTGFQASTIMIRDVSPATPHSCAVMDAFRPIRDAQGKGLRLTQSTFELKRSGGVMRATAAIEMDLGPPSQEIAFLGLEPTGEIGLPDPALQLGRAPFIALAASPDFAQSFIRTGETRYRVMLDTSHTGLSGLMLLSAEQPFTPADKALIMRPPASRGEQWPAQIAEAAARGGWKAQIVWYRAVDDIPG